MNNNFQERIVAMLQESPNGLTSNEIAERLGATAGNISSRLSKLAAYGIIGKARYTHTSIALWTMNKPGRGRRRVEPNSRSVPMWQVRSALQG